MALTLQELCKKINIEYAGDGQIVLTHICGINKVEKGGVAYITDPDGVKNLPTPKGVFRGPKEGVDAIKMDPQSALIVPKGVKDENRNLIFSDDPLMTQIEISRYLYPELNLVAGIHKDATVDPAATLGKQTHIEARAVIEKDVIIGDNTIIKSGVVIMAGTRIGQNCLIYPNVTIRENCIIGDDVIIQPNAVIGSDGFGFFSRNGKNLKVPQVGNVIIEDRVEIGSCTTIDRARYYHTIIKEGCKLDNLIHIAHNVELGKEGLMAAQSAIAGSAIVGSHLMAAGRSGIKDNITVEDNVTVLTQGVITSNTKSKEIIAGFPGRPLKKWKRLQAIAGRLDKIYDKVKKLEKAFK